MALRKTPLRCVLAILTTATLAGCQSDQAELDWTPPRVAAEPDVQLTEFRHEVTFASGSSTIASATAASLTRFVVGAEVAPQDHVVVVGARPNVGEAPEMGQLVQRRQAAVARFLADRGVPSRLAQAPATGADSGQQAVVVLVRRTVVGLPACPDWTGEPGANANNRQLRNWSCSTAVNFGMMVADPSDLLLGRDPGYADGELMARSIEFYRKGKTKDLIRDAASAEIFPSTSSSSSSGSSN
jgi:pilus assembly protein CpaD